MKLLPRRLARLCALQALYSWQISNNDISVIENHVIKFQNIQSFNVSYFHELYVGVINCVEELEKIIIPYLFRDFEKIDYIEYSVLLIAVFELTQRSDIPYKVTINEAIELSKIFGAEKSHKFINGVLDRIAVKILKNKKNR